MQSVKVDRSKWLNAHYSPEGTKMMDSNGNMCCLGFATQQICNLPDSILKGRGTPQGVFSGSQEYDSESYKLFCGKEIYDDLVVDPRWFNTPFSKDAMELNDTEDISRENREEELIKLFASEGIELTFFGEYPDVPS